MMKLIFLPLLLAAAPASAAVPETVSVRAVAADPAWLKASDREWTEKLLAEIGAAIKEGADAIVLPEGASAGRRLDAVLPQIKEAAGPDRLIVIGNSIVKKDDYAVSRAYVYSSGGWIESDKLDPTPAERAAKPPVRGGMRLLLFRFRGGIAAALPASSAAKPEIAVSLKRRGVSLLLVSAPAEDEEGLARLERAASARAVELGAAVVIAHPSRLPSVYLPAQKGIDPKPAAEGKTVRLPWKKLLELRNQGPKDVEPRPFLEPAPAYQTEL